MFKFISKSNTKNRKGFTLLELLIYVTIFSIISVVLVNVFISLSRADGQSSAKSEVDSAIRFSNELLRQDIKNASIISVPASGSSSTLTLTRNAVTIVYDISNGILRRKEGNNNPVNLTDASIIVSTPTFARIENTNTVFNTTNVSIKINMTFSYNSTSADWVYTTSLQNTVNLF